MGWWVRSEVTISISMGSGSLKVTAVFRIVMKLCNCYSLDELAQRDLVCRLGQDISSGARTITLTLARIPRRRLSRSTDGKGQIVLPSGHVVNGRNISETSRLQVHLHLTPSSIPFSAALLDTEKFLFLHIWQIYLLDIGK